MRIFENMPLRIALAALTLLLCALTWVLSTINPASASTQITPFAPLPQELRSLAPPRISANSNCAHGTIRPRHIFTGQGIAPEATGLIWSFYGAHSARSEGNIIYPSTRTPARHGSVSVHRVRFYSGRRFFTRMTWTIPRPSAPARIIDWNFRREGGTCPGWAIASDSAR